MTTTALVTGANRGIGLAIANALASAGLKVLMACRNISEGEEARSTSELNDMIKVVNLDLSDKDTIESQVQAISDKYGPIDVLVNNAGVSPRGGILSVPKDDIYHAMQVNCFAAFELIRLLAPSMNRRGYGRIVNISSGYGAFSEGLSGPAAYSLSKCALNALTVIADRELDEGVKINAMCPGWVRTRMGGAEASRSPEHGAETAVWLATLPRNGPSGGFFRDKRVTPW
eukprot:CFRG2298T1